MRESRKFEEGMLCNAPNHDCIHLVAPGVAFNLLENTNGEENESLATILAGVSKNPTLPVVIPEKEEANTSGSSRSRRDSRFSSSVQLGRQFWSAAATAASFCNYLPYRLNSISLVLLNPR